MAGTRIIHPSFMVKTYGKPRLGRGKIGRGLRLNGDKQIADLGEHHGSCFGNLDNCPHGALLGLWLKPNDMKENMYFLSSGLNGITIGYNRGRLVVNAATTTREWRVSSDPLPEGEWHYIEVSWHPQKGLKLYKDNKMIKESSRYVERDLPTDFSYKLDQDQFYLGRGNREMIDAHYGDASYDELQYWYGSREYLLAFGYLQRGINRFSMKCHKLIVRMHKI